MKPYDVATAASNVPSRRWVEWRRRPPWPALDETGMRYAISFGAQQVSGLWSWVEDPESHRESFRYWRHGRAQWRQRRGHVQSGFTGVRDVLSGRHNAMEALSTQPHPKN